MSDLIDRQAAIDAYGDWYVEEGTEDGFIGTVKQLLEGFPSAQLGTDLAEVGTDCISRQAAIDALEKVAELFPWRVPGNRDSYDRYNEAWNDSIGRAEIEIEKLPSAQPDIVACGDCIHWICHDRRCGYWNHGVKPLDWCCHAERRTDG